MIISYVGTPGSGKTYEAMILIRDNLRKGRRVYCNIDGCNEPEYREALRILTGLEPYDFDTNFIFLEHWMIPEFWLHTKPKSLIVIDEIHKYFGNRDWMSEKNKQFCVWAREHRHHGYDLVMLSTHIESVDKGVREISQFTYLYRKVDYFGKAVKNSYQVGYFFGDNINTKAYEKKVHRYNPKIFKTYKSYVTEDIKEAGIRKHLNILMHPIFFILPVAVVFAIYMMTRSSLFGGGLVGMLRGGKSSAAEAKVSPKKDDIKKEKTKVIEFKDLKAKEKEMEKKEMEKRVSPSFNAASPDRLAAGSGAAPPSPPVEVCKVVGVISSGEDEVTIERCGNRSIQKKNGQVVHIGNVRGSGPEKAVPVVPVVSRGKIRETIKN